MTNTSDIILVGGGVISLLSAYFLHQAGAKITIIDKGEIGKESSWAGGGIISPLYPWRYPDPINKLSAYSQLHYQAVAEALHDTTGINPEWVRSGLLMVENEDNDSELKSWAEKFDKKLQWLDQHDVQQYEPQCSSEFSSGVVQDDVAQIRNPWLVRSLKAYLEIKGINFLENTSVEAINREANRVIGVTTDKGKLSADKVIIASGAWSGLFPELSAIDVRPVMGQMILYKTEPGFLKRIIMSKGRYVIPRADGHILCGSTLEWNGYDKITTQVVREELRQAAAKLVPALAKTEIIKQWSGLRPGSPNGVPYIGEHPEINNLYVNTGHYRYGVVMGLASARLLSDIIEQTESFIDKNEFSIETYREPSEEFKRNDN